MAKTRVVFIADESYSMQHLQDTSISSFNEYVDDLRSGIEGKAALTLVKFASTVEVVYANKPLDEVPELTTKTYRPHGCTALFDAIGKGVEVTAEAMKKKDRAIVVIMTDGQENASKEMTSDSIKGVISKYEAKGNWTFVYLGANQNAWAAAGNIGIARGNAANYAATDRGHRTAVRALANVTNTYSSLAPDSLASATRFADAGVSLTADGFVADTTSDEIVSKVESTRK